MTAATVGPIAPLGRHSSPLRTFVARATAIAALGATRPRVNVSRSSSRARRGMRDDARARGSVESGHHRVRDGAADDARGAVADDGGDRDDRVSPSSSSCAYASARDVPFRKICVAFERIQGERGRTKANAARRYRALDALHDRCFVSRKDGSRVDAFDAYRLLLPSLDKERAVYQLKHDALAKATVLAFDMSPEGEDAKRLIDWKQKGGGNFPQTVRDVLAAGHLEGREGDEDVRRLTVGEVNESLDALAACTTKEERVATLRKLFAKMDATQAKWTCCIILKETKLRMGDKSVLRHYHRDAEDLFDWTSDLRRVCEDLPKREVRLKRADIEVGQGLVNPQLAKRQNSVDAVYKALKGKQFVVETKFDGERIQIHKDGDVINYWTRNMNDFGPRGYDVMDGLFRHLPKRCILDGELLVWNKLREQWYPFGALKNLINAANLRKSRDELFPLMTHLDDRDGNGDDGTADPRSSKYAWYAENVKKLTYGDLELVYVPFDILYIGDESIRHLKLSERHEKLRESVRQMSVMCGNIKARIQLATPDCEFARVGSTKEDIEHALLEAMDNGEEGLVIKDLNGEWKPGDRSSNWMKIKPDYLKTEDLDVLLIGGYYGAGEMRGGKISQFLVGIVESTNDPTSDSGIKIMSFCKVGTGISAVELDDLRNRLGDYMHREKPREMNYTVTDAYNERPDVWIWPPQRSVVVRVKGDIRIIRTTTFASGYSLRFPRVTGIRYDKKWSDLLSYAELKQTVEENRPNIGVDFDDGRGGTRARKRTRSAATTTLLPAHLMPVDVSGVKQESEIFKNMQVHIVNCDSREEKQELFKAIIARGGMTSEMWHGKVTHCVAVTREGTKFKAACQHGDVLTIDWLKDCIREGRVIPPRPKHRLHLATSTWFGSDTMDRYGDDHFLSCDEEDIQALLHQVGDQTKRWETAEIPAVVELDRSHPQVLNNSKYFVFRECVFEIDFSHEECETMETENERRVRRCEERNFKNILKLYGGKIADEAEFGTHVVRMCDDTVYEQHTDDGRVIISNGWIQRCIARQTTSQI